MLHSDDKPTFEDVFVVSAMLLSYFIIECVGWFSYQCNYDWTFRFLSWPYRLLDIVCDVQTYLVKWIIFLKTEWFYDNRLDRFMILCIFTVLRLEYSHLSELGRQFDLVWIGNYRPCIQALFWSFWNLRLNLHETSLSVGTRFLINLRNDWFGLFLNCFWFKPHGALNSCCFHCLCSFHWILPIINIVLLSLSRCFYWRFNLLSDTNCIFNTAFWGFLLSWVSR